LRLAGLAGVVGEVSGCLTLTASRRLQLAAEESGVTCFALRRPWNESNAFTEPIAALTRWRVSALPTPPPLAHSPDTPGLSRLRYRQPRCLSVERRSLCGLCRSSPSACLRTFSTVLAGLVSSVSNSSWQCLGGQRLYGLVQW
jgi:hypothetical protein